MEPPTQLVLQQQQLLDSLSVHTIHNLQPPPSPVRLGEHIETFTKDILREDVAILLTKPTIKSPAARNTLPFADYFVSSSHNTYLLSNQVLGKASALSYTHVLSQGARCVEIDVWPSSKGPIVTHGHTFSQSIPFADVCAAIGASVYPDTWPVLVSLECHVYGEERQEELVRIMREAWGEKFVDGKQDDVEDKLTPEMVMGRILVMVEYYPFPHIPGSNHTEPLRPSSSSPSSSSSDSGHGITSLWPHKRSQVPRHLRISPVLAAVGFYLRSMKPMKNWFSQLFTDPPNILINISESSLLSLLTNSKTILNILVTHAQTHIRRIYPKGLRLTSSNLRPYIFWGSGSHVVALNWQSYDLGMQVNEGMFVGTPGWVVKPKWMREPITGDKYQDGRKTRIKGEVVGVCSTPPPSDRQRTPDSKPYNAYVKAQLLLPSPTAVPPSPLNILVAQTASELEYRSEPQNVKPISGDLDFAYPVDKADSSLAEEWDNLWWRNKHEERALSKAVFEWEIFEKWEELTFLRLSVCKKEFGKDEELAIFCARLTDIRAAIVDDVISRGPNGKASGWRAVRLLDLNGKDCGAIALVRFTFDVFD
ncbi:1-phosphatidylinositol 4,5-bisphosphate phosphodiesterase 1 [Leucoagaricus sp. SymC.cos]|nr:1-phosphatidylinositol 4,5-bisphosphate phosphodiesterase 1 [Leucoagaricus sp. SymC.cos]